MNLFFRFCLVALCSSFIFPCVALAAKPVTLTVYTSLEPDMLNKYSKAFSAQYPDITIKWVRESAGPITARLQAEKDAPRADAVIGLALHSILYLEQYDMFASYVPVGAEFIDEKMRDRRANPVWVGTAGWTTALCINNDSMAKRGLPIPQTWEDLLDPVYKGLIVAPDPVSSSTGYMTISGWLLEMGEEAAWEFMRQLHPQIGMYIHSGSRPAQMVAQGEFPIAITSAPFACPFIKKKAPIEVILPKGKVGWDLEAAVIIKNRPHVEQAKALMDFVCTEEVARIAAEGGYLPARVEFTNAEDVATREACLDMDFYKNSKQRDAILQKWRQLFNQ